MARIIHLTFVIFLISVDFTLSAKKQRPEAIKSQDDAYAWLNKYGYNPCLNSGVQCSLSLPSILKNYQERFRLAVTGKLDEPTKQHMNRPRCGNVDKPPERLSASASAQLRKMIWKRSSLTYSLHGYPTEIDEKRTSTIIREAFNAWLDHVPLKIDQVRSKSSADFVIDFSREQHDDTYPFDGVGGTLAHAFFPEDGRVHFDKDEKWTESFTSTDTNLYLVAVHEIGHALGLDHTYNEKSIMYPSYQPMPKSRILPETDRQAIQALYGTKQSSSSAATRSTTTTTTTTTTTRRSLISTHRSSGAPNGRSHPRCRLFLDTAFQHPDGTLHTFNAGILWRYLIDEGRWDAHSNTYKSTYLRLPNSLTGGTFDRKAKQIVFFSETDVYHYDINSRQEISYKGEERLAPSLRRSIVGAIYYRNQIHVITAKTIRLYQVDNNYQQSNARDLTEEFPRFKGTVMTAFTAGGLHYFFTLDRLVYVWSERLNSWETLGKPMETSWLACSGRDTYNIRDSGTEAFTRKPHSRHPPNHRHEHY